MNRPNASIAHKNALSHLPGIESIARNGQFYIQRWSKISETVEECFVIGNGRSEDEAWTDAYFHHFSNRPNY